MFDFSNESTGATGSGDIIIFNNGEAGKVENVTVKVEKKGVDYPDEQGKKHPDYKVIFTDNNGGTTNEGFYYLDQSTHDSQYRSFEDEVKRQWRKLGHIVEMAGGHLEIKFDKPKDMLDIMAKSVKQAVEGKTFNVFANYGHINNPRIYIQIRSWVPFIELAGTSNSKLRKTNIDQMERLLPDSEDNLKSSDGWV